MVKFRVYDTIVHENDVAKHITALFFEEKTKNILLSCLNNLVVMLSQRIVVQMVR